jgi:hypothetical protein
MHSTQSRRGSEIKLIFTKSDKHRYTFVKITMQPYNRNGDSTSVQKFDPKEKSIDKMVGTAT